MATVAKVLRKAHGGTHKYVKRWKAGDGSWRYSYAANGLRPHDHELHAMSDDELKTFIEHTGHAVKHHQEQANKFRTHAWQLPKLREGIGDIGRMSDEHYQAHVKNTEAAMKEHEEHGRAAAYDQRRAQRALTARSTVKKSRGVSVAAVLQRSRSTS